MAISIPVAQGGIRPDDRAVRGVVAVEGTADLNTPATTIPYVSQGAGVDQSLFQGEPTAQPGDAGRPDDRAVRGVVAVEGTADLNTPASRPDDRAVHGVVALDGSDGTAVSGANVAASAPRVALADDQGFAWTEAALGASTMLVLLCVLAGAGLLIARHRKPALG
jgi:hypothetical protein